MENVLVRFFLVWLVLHIILFFVEICRYKRSNRSWRLFKADGMLDCTYFILCFDQIGSILAIAGFTIYWIMKPMIH